MNKTITIAAASIARAETVIADHNKKIGKINRRHGLALALATLKVLRTRVANVTGPGGREHKVEMAEVEVTGEAAVIAGWEICAVISAVEDDKAGYAISRVHGASIVDVEPFAARGGSCDHCKASRRRNTTYLVKSVAGRADEEGQLLSAAGEIKARVGAGGLRSPEPVAGGLEPSQGSIKVVGSTCVADFTGHKSPAGLVAYADMMSGFEAELDALEDEGDDIASGRTAPPVSRASVTNLVLFLAYVRAAIRTFGWVSRGEAYDTGRKATANVAFESLEAVRIAERFMESDVPERDGVTGDTAPELVAAQKATKPNAKDHADAASDVALVEEKLESLEGRLDDFQTNVALVVRQGFVFYKSLGIGAAICRMADRIREDNRARNVDAGRKDEHAGTVGERATWNLTVIATKPIVSAYGPSTLHEARDAEGRAVKWFAKGAPLELGTYSIKGTVKDHGYFGGKKETVLNRVEVLGKAELTVGDRRDRLAAMAKRNKSEDEVLADIVGLIEQGLSPATELAKLTPSVRRFLTPEAS
jgi:hypothetical protein